MNYKNILLKIFLIALAVSFLACEPDVVQHDIEIEIQQAMIDHDLPSISACVIKDNAIVWSQSYGLADKVKQVRASEETVYHIGSISKLFIATAIMQLEEQGRIDLDADVNNYLPIIFRNPNFPNTPITARILMTHTSGLAWPQAYNEALGIWEQFEPDQAPPPSEWVPQFLIPSGEYYNFNSWKNTEPGKFELYSNIGSNVLAYLVEQISGQNFRDYCKTRIFNPLGMISTSYNLADLDLEKVALLYNSENNKNPFFDDRIFASGGAKSNIQDLSRFAMAYLNKGELSGRRILAASSVERLFELHNPATGTCLLWNIGLGDWYGHTGGLSAGATSLMEIYPKEKTGIIIFCNKSPSVIFPGKSIYGLVKQKAGEFLQ